MEPPQPSRQLKKLVGKIQNRRWRKYKLAEILGTLQTQFLEVQWIEHVRKCKRCQIEVQIAIERYYGRNCPWYLNLEYELGWGSDVYEEDSIYQSCPRLSDYKIGYYGHSSKDTIRFILDRMRWGEDIIKRYAAALVDYYLELEKWDLESPLSPEPELWYPHTFLGCKMGRFSLIAYVKTKVAHVTFRTLHHRSLLLRR